jgi:hypothetical protein
MKAKLFFSLFGLFILTVYSCEKKESNLYFNGRVELYLIQNYSKIDHSSQINENTVVTEKAALIFYSDIISYDSTECIFELSDRAIEAIKGLKHSVNGLAFGIKVNDKLIYTGYFWPGYSSASCDWVVIDPFMTSIGNKIQVRLGYPGLVQGQTIQDKRNDGRIIQILKQDNKLK